MRTRSQVKPIAEVPRKARSAKVLKVEAKKSEYVYHDLEDIVI
jgi:hypothetical protein